ncbi:hypothetical protein BGZ54_009824 [Gamsiella multidivaricata]|nr:hypothetical protein BGZ54_009824 [Gamsiella multidivaricata]
MHNWLQGGPGSSSMIGLFFENGPILVNEHMRLERKPFSWSEEYSVLYIDQPVGTGYSYVTRLHDSDNQEVTDPATVQKILAQLEEELQDDQMNEEEFFRTLTAEGMDSAAKFAAILMKKTRNKVPLYSKGYVKDERGVAADLLVFLDQFYERYPEVQKADLYLTGESYAGKYIPALAYGILESNKGRRHHHEDNDEDDEDEDVKNAKGLTTPQIFPLKGIALGNSLTDPLTQIQVHADHAYYMGLVTRSQADQMRALQDQAVRDAEKGRFLDSNSRRVDVFDLFMNATGGLNWYDVRKGSIPNDWGRMEAFMNLDHVKDSLNVFGPRTSFLKQQGVSRSEIKRIQKGRANTKYFKDLTVIKTMAGDIMRSATWMVSSLLQQGINVLTFQGIFDFRDGVAGSSSWIEGLDWEGQEEFQNAERELWMNEGKLAGYVSQVPGLLRVTVLGAGHLAPMDQGANALAMLKSFVEDSKLPSTTVDEAQELAVAHVI